MYLCLCVCMYKMIIHIMLDYLVHCRELGGSCKLILDVIKCEPPAVKVIITIISKQSLQYIGTNLPTTCIP